jgi:serine/threonine-protein kinase SRK2
MGPFGLINYNLLGALSHDTIRERKTCRQECAVAAGISNIKMTPQKPFNEPLIPPECINSTQLSVVQVFITEASLVICMELANAGNLYRLMETKGTLSESDARHFFQELIVALDYCDRSGLANKLRLKNVLLSGADRDDLQQLTVKLCDFG